ncbi:MAG: Type 1 glutamine amidotransferase-like domain-containing protein [archaeon]
MKLLLTSSGLTSKKLGKTFVEMLERKVEESKILVVHTAQKPEHMTYIDITGKEISRTGILLPNIDYLNIAKKNSYPKLLEYDAVYICGGNTYFILDRMRKTGLVDSLKKYVKSGGLYIGVSAGSIIAGDEISIAGWGSEGDVNEIDLRDLTGLGFTDVSVFPHYNNKLKREVDEFEKLKDVKVARIKDTEAIVIRNNKINKI